MNETNGSAAGAGQAQIRMQVLAQFIRDMSFENVVAQKGMQGGEVQPDVTVQVSLEARKRSQDHQYEVITKFRVTSKNKVNAETLFLLELDYSGIFHVEGVTEEQLDLIEFPAPGAAELSAGAAQIVRLHIQSERSCVMITWNPNLTERVRGHTAHLLGAFQHEGAGTMIVSGDGSR